MAKTIKLITELKEGESYLIRNNAQYDEKPFEIKKDQDPSISPDPEKYPTTFLTEMKVEKRTDIAYFFKTLNFGQNGAVVTQQYWVNRELFHSRHTIFELPKEKALHIAEPPKK